MTIMDSSGPKAENILNDVTSVLNTLTDANRCKLTAILTDSAPAQIAANKLLRTQEEELFGHIVYTITCALHTSKHLESRSTKGFSIAAVPVDNEKSYTTQILHYVKLLFGSRVGDNVGPHTQSLQNQLKAVVKSRSLPPPTFCTDRGSRMCTLYVNACEVLRLWDEVICVAKSHSTNDWAAKLLNIMEDHEFRHLFRAELAVLILSFDKIVKPYHARSSKSLTYDQCMELVQTTRARMEHVVNADGNYFEALLQLEGETSDRVTHLLNFLKQANVLYKCNMPPEHSSIEDEKHRVDTVVKLSLDSMLYKFKYVI